MEFKKQPEDLQVISKIEHSFRTHGGFYKYLQKMVGYTDDEKLRMSLDLFLKTIHLKRPKMNTDNLIEELNKRGSEDLVILILQNEERDRFIWYPDVEVVTVNDPEQSYTAIKSDTLSSQLYPEGTKRIPIECFRKMHSLTDQIAYHFKEPGLSEGQTLPELKPLNGISEKDLEQIRDNILKLQNIILDLDAEQKDGEE